MQNMNCLNIYPISNYLHHQLIKLYNIIYDNNEICKYTDDTYVRIIIKQQQIVNIQIKYAENHQYINILNKYEIIQNILDEWFDLIDTYYTVNDDLYNIIYTFVIDKKHDIQWLKNNIHMITFKLEDNNMIPIQINDNMI